MTTVYFIRHAQSDNTVCDSLARPLTPKGRKDCALVTDFLSDKHIQAVLSSPYQRAIDTVAGCAKKNGLTVEVIPAFREHETILDTYSDDDYFGAIRRYWADMHFKIGNDESLADVQSRNIAALEQVLTRYCDKNVAIGTHGIALSTIINYYDNTYGYEDFLAMVKIKPWVVKMEFNGYTCTGIKKINLFPAGV